jgi:hypothetical protein
MVRKPSRAPNGKTYIYYACPDNPNNARHAAKHPNHVRADNMTAAVDNIISGLLGHDRAAMLAAILPRSQAEQDQRNARHAEELRVKLTQNDTAQNGLITQLAQMGVKDDAASNALRERITAQFRELFTQGKALQAELDSLTAGQEPAPDATLIDELPYAAANIADAPEHIKTQLYTAFDIQALYRQHMKQATIWATITDDTPGTVASLPSDPRTDSDTFGTCHLSP